MGPRNTEDKPDGNTESLVDPELASIIGDLTVDTLSPPDTEKKIDYAIIRLATSVSLEGHEDLNLETRLNVDEYGIIRNAFAAEHGEESIVLILFYKQLHELITQHIVDGRHRLSAEEAQEANVRRQKLEEHLNKSRQKLVENGVNLTQQERKEELDLVEIIKEIRSKIGQTKLSFAEKCSSSYLYDLSHRIMIENRLMALHYKSQLAKAGTPKEREDYQRAYEFYVTSYKHIKQWKERFTLTPLWERALNFLDFIKFREESGKYDRKRELAVKAALELYNISGIPLKAIAEHYDELKDEYSRPDKSNIFNAEESRFKLSKNSRKGQVFLAALYQIDNRIANYVAQDLFSYDSDDIAKKARMTLMWDPSASGGSMEFFEFETENLWYSFDFVDNYIKDSRLATSAARREESMRINMKEKRSKFDAVREEIIKTLNRFQELIGFAYSDKVYSGEEMEILQLLANFKYGIRDSSVFRQMLDDSKDLNVLILDSTSQKKFLLDSILENTSCRLEHVTNIDGLYKRMMSETPPHIIMIGAHYREKSVSFDEAFEFIVGEVKASKRPDVKRIAVYVLGNTIPKPKESLHETAIRDAQKFGARYISVLDPNGIRNVIHEYGQGRPDSPTVIILPEDLRI